MDLLGLIMAYDGGFKGIRTGLFKSTDHPSMCYHGF